MSIYFTNDELEFLNQELRALMEFIDEPEGQRDDTGTMLTVFAKVTKERAKRLQPKSKKLSLQEQMKRHQKQKAQLLANFPKHKGE